MKIKSLIIAVIFAAALIFTPIASMKGFNIERTEEPKTVLELWQIDSMPGGKNSRSGFLSKAAVSYNKQNKNVYIIVKSVGKEELADMLTKSVPDLISYSAPSAVIILPYIKAFSGRIAISDDFFDCGKYANEIYAVPWSYGGYFYIGGGLAAEACTEEFLNPLTALYFSNKRIESLFPKDCSLEETYLRFSPEKSAFIGSSREAIKILRRIDAGKMSVVEITPLPNYTDLTNLLSVTKDENREIAESFIEFLTSDDEQAKLTEIGLFSVTGKKIYSLSPFSDYENAEKRIVKNVFSEYSSTEALALKAIMGDKESKAKLESIYG